jgi:histidyl-tRNA synthetase
MAEIPFPRGVRDLMPNEALFRNELLKKVEGVFQLFGFLTIDTPTFEPLKILKAKEGIGEDTKLIYELKDDELGLRYDHTVSLARYMAMHQDLPLPFRRYCINKVWRREEPQRLRYREITQADADIVGGNSAMADAEVIAVASVILEELGVDYVVCINNRELTDKVLEKFGLGADKAIDAIRAMDKRDKIGESGVSGLLKGLKIEDGIVGQIMSFVGYTGTNDKKLDYIDNILGEGTSTKKTRATLAFLQDYALKGEMRVDFSVMRGLDYYTGIVFEYKNKYDEGVSIGGGGRYDKLIGLYGTRPLPAVGVSFGIDRILQMLEFSASTEYTYANAFVANVNEGNYPYALKVVNALRAAGIPADINVASRNLSNQFAYASAIRTKYVIVVGDSEERDNSVKLRNLLTGNEATLKLDEAIRSIKGE